MHVFPYIILFTIEIIFKMISTDNSPFLPRVCFANMHYGDSS